MKQSPYFNINYGWSYGIDGWNTGMDENLISLSFLDSHTVVSFVESLPDSAPVGNAYILNSDGQVYISLEDGWFFTTLSPGYEFRVSSNNSRWRKTVSGFERIIAVDDTQGQLDSIDQQINSAGGIEERLASAELDIDSLESDVGDIQNDASSLSVTASSQTRNLESWVDFLHQRGNHLGQQPTSTIEDFGNQVLEEVTNSIQSNTLSVELEAGNLFVEYGGGLADFLGSDNGTLTLPDHGSVFVALTEGITSVNMPIGGFGVVKEVYVKFAQPDSLPLFDVSGWDEEIQWLNGVPVINQELDGVTILHLVNVSDTGWVGWQEGYVPDLPTASDILTSSSVSVQDVLDQATDTLDTLGSAAYEDVSAFDTSGSASAVSDALSLLIDERMPSSARAAVDALDATTATLEDLILALQTT